MRISLPTLGDPAESGAQKKPLRDKWDKFVVDYAATAPDGLQVLYQEAGHIWAWIRSEQAFFDGVRQGVTISGLLAFLILLIATQNILIALYAIITVVWIVCFVVAVMVLCFY